MQRTTAGRSLLTFLLVFFAFLNVLFDWNHTHVFNSGWPPHARFHVAWGSVVIWSVAVLAIWLLWRRSPEPELGVKVALLVLLMLCTPFFFLTLVVPGTSLQVSSGAPPEIAGMVIDPQVVIAIIILSLTAWGCRLATSQRVR